MSCKCGKELIIHVQAHSKDCTNITYGKIEHNGYVPHDLGIGGGDDVEFDFCANCGQIQDFSPLTDAEIKEALGHEEDDFFEVDYNSEQDA